MVDALYRRPQGLGQHLQLIAGPDLHYLCVEVAIGQRNHSIGRILYRVGNGVGQSLH